MRRILAFVLSLVLAASTPAFATSYSMWYPTSQTPTGTWTPAGNYDGGQNVYFLEAGTITGYAFWKASTDTSTSRKIILWSLQTQNGKQGAVNVNECDTTGEATGTAQWITCTLATAFPVSAGSTFWLMRDMPISQPVVYTTGTDGCQGSGGSPALACGGSGGGAAATYPNSTSTNAQYVDVIFTPCP